MKPYSFILETIQVQSKYGNVDGRFISHKNARKASGLTGATARAMKIHGTVAATQFRNSRAEHAKGNTAGGNYYDNLGNKAKFFGKAERAEGNGNYEAAELHDKRAAGFGRKAKEIKNS